MEPKKPGRDGSVSTLLVNLLLVCCIIAVFLLYNASYRGALHDQNVTDISNINQSAANISSAFFQNQQKRLADMAQYITLRCLSREGALTYICDSNSDAGSVFELVGADRTGNVALHAAGGFASVDYTNADYLGLAAILTASDRSRSQGIFCTPEFTDGYTARRSFALYTYLRLSESGGDTAPYTLMAVFRSSDFAGLIDLNGGYDDLSTVLVTREGDYVFGSADFKSDNLFKYFYDFNGLSLDEKNSLAASFALSASGEYYYSDGRGRPCVFVYTRVPDTAWSCVSCVPLASFHSTGLNLRFTLWIAVLLTALMAYNVLWLDRANRRLKLSVRKEQEASAAKTDFLSRMSHDIRTPLNVIIGTTLLARREKNPPATRTYLDNIDQSGKFLLSLVNDILDLNKVSSGKMELHPAPYSLRAFGDSMSAIIAPLCREKGLTFTVSGCESEQAYLLDSVRVNQIFFNILSNSVKFTPAGGHVALSCSAVPAPEGRTRLSFRASDDGTGMSEEFQAHMFEAFSQEQRADNLSGQGTGLGLAIVKNLTDLMGGDIRVESAPGRGTAFFISLTAADAPETAEARKAADASLAVLTGRRILLVEDNQINAEIAQTLLEDCGMTVDRAADGREGLDRFDASAPYYYDAVLMDLRMPVMNGLDAARAIRALPRPDAAGTPILAMTANAYDADVRNCLEAGMNAHLSKPIDPDAMFSALAREIASALDRRSRG